MYLHVLNMFEGWIWGLDFACLDKILQVHVYIYIHVWYDTQYYVYIIYATVHTCMYIQNSHERNMCHSRNQNAGDWVPLQRIAMGFRIKEFRKKKESMPGFKISEQSSVWVRRFQKSWIYLRFPNVLNFGLRKYLLYILGPFIHVH